MYQKLRLEEKLLSMKQEVEKAHEMLHNGTGEGSDFLGWVDLPVTYDKEEFAQIKECAEKIKKDSEALIVLGIGGSYLGARAVIEYLKSPLYNNLKKDTPDIYFAGNSISSSALSDLLKICEGKDICVNVVSKSGTTTEPAVAFRIFRNLLEEKYGKEGAKERIFGINPCKVPISTKVIGLSKRRMEPEASKKPTSAPALRKSMN